MKATNTLKMFALGSVLIGGGSMVNAGVLLGFNTFTEDTPGAYTDSIADEAKAGWSGTIDHNTQGFIADGGSTDGFYGNDYDVPGLGHMIYSATTSNNGYVDGAGGVKFSGVAGTSGTIDALLFDAASVSATRSTFNVSWTFWDSVAKTNVVASGATPTSGANLLAVGPGVNTNYTSNYNDFAINLGSFFLPTGGYFEIVWNRLSGPATFKLDNIALVPEPGSLMGLGCLLGFGLLQRSRRR